MCCIESYRYIKIPEAWHKLAGSALYAWRSIHTSENLKKSVVNHINVTAQRSCCNLL